MSARFFLMLFAFFVLLIPVLGQCQESVPVLTRHARATLVADTPILTPGQSFMVGLRLQLQPGWHSYWVNPGDAGDATRLSLTRPDNLPLQTGPLLWPVPERLKEGPLMAYAYTGEVLLPLKVSVPDAKTGNPVTLKAHAEWLVCAELCVPESGDFTLTLPVGADRNALLPSPAIQKLFQQSLAAFPQPVPGTARISPQGVLAVMAAAPTLAQTREAWFLPLEPGQINQDAPQPWHSRTEEGRTTLTLDLSPDSTLKPPFWKSPLQGVLVRMGVDGKQTAWRVTAQPGAGKAMPVSVGVPVLMQESALWQLVAFAFLGGLILNLMPCVFPVLAMKALALMRVGGEARNLRVRSAGLYTLGIVASFLVLGGTLLGVKATGGALGAGAGWGFQFQSPVFVVGLCWALLLLALNLLGVFQITGGRLVNALGNLSPIAGASSGKGDFFTGCLAVITATPCTAPFMGVAIAGALAAGPVEALALFGAMGLGLASPYVLLALCPGLSRFLPRPGSWMETFRQLLAFPLFATCAWLVWVVSFQQGSAGVGLALGGAVLLGLGAWAWGHGQRLTHGKSLFLCRVTAVLSFGGCVMALVSLVQLELFPPQAGRSVTEPFSEQRLSELRAEHRPVLVDMTAAWCLTCLVNERVALNVPAVQEAFRAQHGVILRGDWTNRNPVLTAWLQTHHRNGVPLYVFYPAQLGANPQLLPQLLTPSLVLNALAGVEK